MREILFRGRSIQGRAWYEGDLINTQGHIPPYMPMIVTTEFNSAGTAIDVDPDTVGQYTGLQDKNGERIFEGDIVADGDEIFVCFWDGCNVEFGVKNKDLSFGIAYLPITEYEVIGNIHDNPELMDGGDDHED